MMNASHQNSPYDNFQADSHNYNERVEPVPQQDVGRHTFYVSDRQRQSLLKDF